MPADNDCDQPFRGGWMKATTRLGMQSWARLLLRVPRYLFLTREKRELTDEQEDRMFRRKVWLRVEEAFKGAEPGRTVLFTGWGGGDCGYRFRRGDRYLVYAGDSDDGLYTGICYSTKPLEEARSELATLRRLVDAASEERRSHPAPSSGSLAQAAARPARAAGRCCLDEKPAPSDGDSGPHGEERGARWNRQER
jgi:hypothetical protein